MMMGFPTQITRFMGPTWGPPGANRTQVGSMLAPWTLLSGYTQKDGPHIYHGTQLTKDCHDAVLICSLSVLIWYDISFLIFARRILLPQLNIGYFIIFALHWMMWTAQWKLRLSMSTKSYLIARFMEPTWGPPGADRTQVGPMWATGTLLSGIVYANGVQSSHMHCLKLRVTDTIC